MHRLKTNKHQTELPNGAFEKYRKQDIHNWKTSDINSIYKQKNCQNNQNKLLLLERHNRILETEKNSFFLKTPVYNNVFYNKTSTQISKIHQSKISNRSLSEKNSNKIENSKLRPQFTNSLQSRVIESSQSKLQQKFENGIQDISEDGKINSKLYLSSDTSKDISSGILNNGQQIENKKSKNTQNRINIISCASIKPPLFQNSQNRKSTDENSSNLHQNSKVNLNMPITPIINRLYKNHKLGDENGCNTSLIHKDSTITLNVPLTTGVIEKTDKQNIQNHLVDSNKELLETNSKIILSNPNNSVTAIINNKNNVKEQCSVIKVPHNINFNKLTLVEKIPQNQEWNESYSGGLLKAYSSQMSANASLPSTSSILTGLPVQQKDCKSTYIQTDSNYTLPLTMIFVDNRALHKDMKNDKIEVQNTNTSHITQDVVNKKVQCIMKEEMANKKVQCIIKEKVTSTSTQYLPEVGGLNEAKWPGVNKIVESYHAYSKGKFEGF